MAERWPDRVALAVGKERATAAALLIAAKGVAATVQRLPQRRAAPVLAVLCRPGLVGVQGLVGGWLAGLAVAPLDPDLPPGLMAEAIRALSPRALFVDAGSTAVLPKLLPELPAHMPVVLPDAAAARTVRGVGERTPIVAVERRAGTGWQLSPARPGDTAAHLWLTRRGGGDWVARSHADLLSDVDRHAARHGVRGGDRVSHLYPLSVHRGLVDLLLPWSVGGTACAPDPDAGGRIAAWLREARMSILRLTPTRLRAFEAVGALTPAALATVRAVVLEGEGHRGKDVATLRGAAPEAVIDSVFGRTETGSAVLVQRVQPGPVSGDHEPTPLGRPFPGVKVAVTDAQGRPVAPGSPGMLVVAGPGGAVVRTGDRVRAEKGRGLVHLGRVDDMVQLNGRRVSLDTVGRVLGTLAGAPVAVVGWPLGAPGSAQGLVAFVQADSVDADAILHAARAQLPRGLVPAELLAVPGLPRRADGGPDRLRLTRFLAGRPAR
jgi:acyl-CoA synthetase (AMP-forming)/AMP-acid ligase II